MQEEELILAVFITLSSCIFSLVLFRQIANFKLKQQALEIQRLRLQNSGQDNDELSVSELKAIVEQSVHTALKPLEKRIKQIEQPAIEAEYPLDAQEKRIGKLKS